MRVVLRLVFVVVFLSVPFLSRAAADSVRVSLLTCSPGMLVYEHYGHTAIRVENFTRNSDVVFNYGMFDFNSPNFIWRFVLGKTDYFLGVQNFSGFRREYESRGSFIVQQKLNISESEAREIVAALVENSLPGNRVYRYNFLYNNCTTMARDQVEKNNRGYIVYPGHTELRSFRSIIREHNGFQPWAQFGIDLCLGSEADRLQEGRNQMFAPLVLMAMVDSAIVVDSLGAERSLVEERIEIVSGNGLPSMVYNRLYPLQTAVIALLLTLLICGTEWYRGKVFWYFDLVVFGLQGLVGLVITFLFLFSEHPAVGSNFLVICLNPIPLFLLPFIIKKLKRRKTDFFHLVNAGVILLFLALSPIIPQEIQTATKVFILLFAVRSLSNFFLVRKKILIPEENSKKTNSWQCSNVKMIILLFSLSAFSVIRAQGVGSIGEKNSPKLLVGIVVDQLNTEYLETLLPLFGNDGLKMLWYDGYNRPNGFYNVDKVDRASAVASIYSGTWPFYHGIVGERWFERRSMNVACCVDDSRFNGINTIERVSPRKLLVSNLADEIKVATGGKAIIFAVAAEKDAAILSAGHEADAAMWINEADGRWSGTDYYGQLPEWINTIDDTVWVNQVWKPVYPVVSYLTGLAVNRPPAFSYTYKRDNIRSYKCSPLVNDRITRMAIESLKGFDMGLDNYTDMLTVTYYAGDPVKEGSESYSLERQDLFVRLDQNIADLIRETKKHAGNDNVLFFLTSTGYSHLVKPDASRFRIPSGEVRMERVTALLNLYLSALYGQGVYFADYYDSQLFLDHSILDSKRITLSEIFTASVDFLSQVTGVRGVLAARRDLFSGNLDSGTRKKLNAFHPDCSGDIILEISPGWTIIDDKRSIERYVRDVSETFPIIIYGAGVRSEIDRNPVTVGMLAPTLARILRIQAPNASVEEPIMGLR